MFRDLPRRTTVLLLVLGVAMSAAAGGAIAAVAQDDPEDGPVPDDYDENDSFIEYDRGNYQLALWSANDSPIEYELTFFGAIEPANETAEGTVDCIEEYCVVAGELDPGERAVYNASGFVFEVAPERNLTVGVQGTFDGNATMGLGLGQIADDNDAEASDDESLLAEDA